MDDRTNDDAAAVESQPAAPALSEEARTYILRLAEKQGRLAGEDRATAENVPADRRAEFVSAVVTDAQSALAALDAEQLQALEDAGRNGRIAVCRAILGLA